jgi:hypothetical protein
MLTGYLKTGTERRSSSTFVVKMIAFALFVILGAGGVVTTAEAGPITIAGTLVSDGTRDFTGTGFGVVLPVLTLQNSQGSEMGGIGWNGSADFSFDTVTGTGTGGDPDGSVKDQGVHSRTYTFQDLINAGITNTNNLGLVFNVNETGSNPGTTLQDVRIGVYQVSTGTWVLQSGTCSGTNPTCPGAFPVTNQGQGGDGYLFQLSGVDLSTYFASPTLYRIGLWANITGSDDGPEDFYFQSIVCTTNCNPPPPVPEPASLALFGSGLFAAASAMYRRRRLAAKVAVS